MKYGEYPRVAVLINEVTRYGFLVRVDSGRDEHRVRILHPLGETEVTLQLKDILGFVGVTFERSLPTRPEPCERLVFFDGDRQRKGWVWDLERSGKVTLLVDYHEVLPAGKSREEVRVEDIETKMEFTERWLEELALLPDGQGFRRLSDEEVDELVKNVLKEVGGQAPSDPAVRTNGNGYRPTMDQKGGGKDLAVKAARGAERLRELMARVSTTTKGA